MDFSNFDSRGYRTVDARTGYGAWVETYEDTVNDAMDIALFDRLTTPRWKSATRALDLGCGTGRTGAWLRDNGVTAIDGVDVTPQMLTLAEQRGAHDRLIEADVTATGLPDDTYDLLTASLIDEHLSELGPLYREAARVATADATFAMVSFHPHFIMSSGMPTHFTSASGEHIAITTTVHLVSDHITAGIDAGWQLVEMREALIDDEWIAVKPKWERYRDQPISTAYVWRRA
ncbi:MAG: methyltransferase domain-containing protein [Actinophytocola sp.]|nr:methyltransferase domain-containing protein [Actinophytocola sp.]